MEKRNKQTAYKQAYNERSYARLAITIPKGRKATVEALAKERGESVNGFINGLIRDAMRLTEAEWKRDEAEGAEGAEA